MYIDCIWPFTTFISRNKHNKNIRLRLYWLRLTVAEAEVQTSKLLNEHFVSENKQSCLCADNVRYKQVNAVFSDSL